MAEEVKNEQHDDSTDTAEKVVDENPPADKEQPAQSAEGNDAEADSTTPDGKSIDPEDQTFWEDSVDANTVDIAEGQTVPKEATEEKQPAEQEPVAENDAEQVEAQVEEETAAADTPPAEEEPAKAEEAQEPDADEKESPTAETEETDSTSPTPDSPEGENEDQPVDQKPVAEKGPEQEGTKEEEDNAAAASDETQPKRKVLSFYRRLNKKTLIAGSGILLLIAGSIGFTVVPGLRSSGTGTSTFLGGIPDTAYDMKFFLPLDVGYEKSQFVKVTIALELMDEGLQKEIDKNISQLRKEVINLILTKSPKEVKSSSGKKELSREITSRINNYLSKDCIKGTYFTELVIL